MPRRHIAAALPPLLGEKGISQCVCVWYTHTCTTCDIPFSPRSGDQVTRRVASHTGGKKNYGHRTPPGPRCQKNKVHVGDALGPSERERERERERGRRIAMRNTRHLCIPWPYSAHVVVRGRVRACELAPVCAYTGRIQRT